MKKCLDSFNLQSNVSQAVANDGKWMASTQNAEPQVRSMILIPQGWGGNQTIFEMLIRAFRDKPKKKLCLVIYVCNLDWPSLSAETLLATSITLWAILGLPFFLESYFNPYQIVINKTEHVISDLSYEEGS